MREVQCVRGPGRPTPTAADCSGTSVLLGQPDCIIQSDILVHTHGDLYVSRHSLNVTCCGMRSQCWESLMWLVMWSYSRRQLVT